MFAPLEVVAFTFSLRKSIVNLQDILNPFSVLLQPSNACPLC